MATGDVWYVTAKSGLNIRKGPGTSYPILGSLTTGSKIIENSRKDGYVSFVGSGRTGGWVFSGYLSKTNPNKVSTSNKNPTKNPVSETQKQENNVTSGKDTYDDGGITSGANANPDSLTNLDSAADFENAVQDAEMLYDIERFSATFGMPYQFLGSADPRVDGSDPFIGNDTGIGSEFAERIVSKMPILFIAPGRPNFMTKFSKKDKETSLKRIFEEFGSWAKNQVGLEDLIEGEGKYYTFDYDLIEYYKYVNPMCRIAARYLQLEKHNFNGTKLDMVNWYDYAVGHSDGIMERTEYMNIPFYIDTDTSISEDFGNSLGESSLASTVNGISDMGREIRFLTGYGSAALDQDWFSQNADAMSNIENINSAVQDILGSGNFITNISKHLNTVASGGRLIFPKIWTDSDVGRSYSIKIKLTSPDCNKLSIFLNILVPLFHLIGLVAPQSIPSNPNGYTNPFIVRAMYKSFFNVDMGIITSMSVDRGAQCMWTVDGLPTSIEVSMTIKDLYDVLTITKSEFGFKYETMSNTAQMDYIANLCGINIYKPEIGRQVSMWLVNQGASIIDIPRNIWMGLNQGVGKAILKLYGRMN